MKQFNIVWFPLIGIPLLILWILKGNLISMYVEEFIFWSLYQATVIALLIEIIK